MPNSDQRPVRRPSQGGRKVTGRFPSAKTRRMVWSEGSLERDFIRLLEFDRDVLDYREQPELIRYLHWPNGDVLLLDEDEDAASLSQIPPGWKRAWYFPDFYVERSSKPPLLVEVKAEKLLEDPDVKRKVVAGSMLAETRGWEFIVVTEAIRTGPRLRNIRILQRYGQVKVPVQAKAAILAAVRAATIPMTIKTLSSNLPGALDLAARQPYIYALIHRGELRVELDRDELGSHTTVLLTSADQ